MCSISTKIRDLKQAKENALMNQCFDYCNLNALNYVPLRHTHKPSPANRNQKTLTKNASCQNLGYFAGSSSVRTTQRSRKGMKSEKVEEGRLKAFWETEEVESMEFESGETSRKGLGRLQNEWDSQIESPMKEKIQVPSLFKKSSEPLQALKELNNYRQSYIVSYKTQDTEVGSNIGGQKAQPKNLQINWPKKLSPLYRHQHFCSQSSLKTLSDYP